MAFLAVLLLMWPAIVNRQPFFFTDTTSYVRAGDYVARVVTGNRLRTAWTARYAAAGPPAASAPRIAPGNDVASGRIMSGRSPYFGVLLWLSYVAGDFWPFVAAQALIAALLIHLSCRLFDLGRRAFLAVVAVLALATSLPFYDAMLMPDALAGFGIMAFMLLAIDRGRLGWRARAALVAIMLLSAISHLTHILIFAGMALLLPVVSLARWRALPAGPALLLGVAVIVIGFGSVAVTSSVVTHVFKHPPQLVPLLTSRSIEDGPGRDYIRAGCGGNRFAVCRLPNAANLSAVDFLWATEPGRGAFMLADPATRARLSAEDRDFFLAAARAQPLATAGAAIRNSVVQMIDFRNMGINQRGIAWDTLPQATAARLRATPTGQDRWPVGVLDAVHYGMVIAAIGLLVAAVLRAGRRPTRWGNDLILWTALFFVAMGVNDVLGGAISIPQYRYQARIVWIIPLLGLLGGLMMRRDARSPGYAA